MFIPTYGNAFGRGHLFHTALRDPHFFERFPEDQAREAGWASGCPVVERLIDPEQGRGAEPMLKRYSQLTFWFRHIVYLAQDENPALARQLRHPVRRKDDEPAGIFDKSSVPPSFFFEMSPMGTLPGYALPRLMLKQIGETGSRQEATDRMVRGLTLLDGALAKSETPGQLVGVFTDGVTRVGDVEPKDALGCVFPVGWFEEYQSPTMLQDVKQAVSQEAPGLWHYYLHLSPADRAANNIL